LPKRITVVGADRRGKMPRMPRKEAVALLNELRRDRAAMDAAISLIESKLASASAQPSASKKAHSMSAETKAKLSRIMKAKHAARKKAKS
jgi:hypothetical protein